MHKIVLTCIMLLGSMAVALTPQEFQQLYESKDKTAEVCYQLYQAYAEGDGVEADKSQARKWLLAAHASGKIAAGKEILQQPWRKKAKLKASIKISEVSAEKAHALGKELVEFMLENGGRNLIGMNMLPAEKPSKKLVSGVRRFIADGADLNVCVREQNDMVVATALYLACKMGDAALMELLIDHGADPNFMGGLALEAFYFPAPPQFTPRVEQMPGVPASMLKGVKKTQKRGAKDKKNQDKRAQKLFALLVKKGADVRMWSHVGWSPVYAAVNANSPLGVQMLVKAGADPDQKQNPQEVAHHSLSARRISYLTQGFGVGEEETPLTTAAIYAKAEVAEALLKAGASPSLSNARGETPLQKARQMQKQLEAKPAAQRDSRLMQGTQAILKLLKHS